MTGQPDAVWLYVARRPDGSVDERRQAWRAVGVAQRRCAIFRAGLQPALQDVSDKAAADSRFEPVHIALADVLTQLDMLMVELDRLLVPDEYRDEMRPQGPANGARHGVCRHTERFNRSAGQFRFRLARIQLWAQGVVECDSQLEPVVNQMAVVASRIEVAMAAIVALRTEGRSDSSPVGPRCEESTQMTSTPNDSEPRRPRLCARPRGSDPSPAGAGSPRRP